MKFVQPIRSLSMIHEIEDKLKDRDMKYFIMFEIGVYSGLRISDILALRVKDVYRREYISVTEKKTGKEKRFPINRELKKSIDEYCAGKGAGEFLVPSGRTYKRLKAISRAQAYNVIRSTCQEAGLEHIGTHTLRKTFGYHFYQQTKDVALLMSILNHSDPSITLRYIGIQQDTEFEAMEKYTLKGYDCL